MDKERAIETVKNNILYGVCMNGGRVLGEMHENIEDAYYRKYELEKEDRKAGAFEDGKYSVVEINTLERLDKMFGILRGLFAKATSEYGYTGSCGYEYSSYFGMYVSFHIYQGNSIRVAKHLYGNATDDEFEELIEKVHTLFYTEGEQSPQQDAQQD